MPVEDVYSPPLNIKVYDKRMFGHTPLVGSYVINSLKEYEETGPVEQGLSQLASEPRCLFTLYLVPGIKTHDKILLQGH